MRLQDKVIVVTGSTTGIGRAIARAAVAEGAKVLIHGRREDAAIQLCEELSPSAHYVTADLVHPDQCQIVIEAALKHFGRIDSLVNNAALTTRSTIETSDAALIDRIMAVNVRAPILLARSAVSAFRSAGKGGVILNIGSINAYCGQTDLLVYSMSKGALMTFTRNLADAMGPEQIRVNQINVGWTATENEIKLKKSEGLAEGWQNEVSPRYAPSGQLLTPENIAAHALFWLSDASAPASGVVSEVEQFPVIGRQDNRQANDVDS